METSVSDSEAISNYLASAVAPLTEAGELFGLPSMAPPEICEAAESYPGAFIWLTGLDHTLLMGLQCEEFSAIGLAMGETEADALDSGTDGLCELLNIVAGGMKANTKDFDDSTVLGLPVLVTGPIAPRVVLASQALRVQFGDLVIVASLAMIDLSPEAKRRKQEEEKNKQLVEELQLSQKLEAVGQLAAGVAHEINTPLQYLGDTIGFLEEAFADLKGLVHELDTISKRFPAQDGGLSLTDALGELKEEADVDFLVETVPESIETARKGLSKVCTVVEALKSVGSAGQMQRTLVDINDLLVNTLVVTNNIFEMVADVEEDLTDLPEITADPGQLGQVFIQLLTNAAEAIQVSLSELPEDSRGSIRVSTQHVDNEILVEISDTGCGIPDSIRDRLFDPFFTTKGVGKNMGQGLSTVRSIIVDRHSGTIDVDSTVGQGTRISLHLPL